MTAACPVQTPAERQRAAIVSNVETALMDKVLMALREADETASSALRASGLEDVPSLEKVFTASVHQKLYCMLCGADPKTFSGGDPKTAIAIIRNSQQIAKTWGADIKTWGADIEPYPRP